MEDIYAELEHESVTLEQSQELSHSRLRRPFSTSSQQSKTTSSTEESGYLPHLRCRPAAIKNFNFSIKTPLSKLAESSSGAMPSKKSNNMFADYGQTVYTHDSSGRSSKGTYRCIGTKSGLVDEAYGGHKLNQTETGVVSKKQLKNGRYDIRSRGTIIHPPDEDAGDVSSDPLNLKTDGDSELSLTESTKINYAPKSFAGREASYPKTKVSRSSTQESKTSSLIKSSLMSKSARTKSVNTTQGPKFKNGNNLLKALDKNEPSTSETRSSSTPSSRQKFIETSLRAESTVSGQLIVPKNRPVPREFPMSEKFRRSNSRRSTSSERNSSHSEDDQTSEYERSMLENQTKQSVQGITRPFPMSPTNFSHKPPSVSSSVSESTRNGSESDEYPDPIKLFGYRDVKPHSGNSRSKNGLSGNDLCPFCDMVFPSKPSPFLLKMLSGILPESYPDPRPTNKLGRKAPLLTYLNMCQRHQFEQEQLPAAVIAGWPTHIDFSRLPKRVKGMRTPLDRIIKSKKSSFFWEELETLFKDKGVRSVVGITGQFENFEKRLPGYYGEQGSIIIFRTLTEMFPPEIMDVDAVAPLTPDEFLQFILVPECAIRLIQADMRNNGDKKASLVEAIQTLRESSKYGIAMFPDLDNREGPSLSVCMTTRKGKTPETRDEGVISKDVLPRGSQGQKAERSRRRKGLVSKISLECRRDEERKGKVRRDVVASSGSELEAEETPPCSQLTRDGSTRGKKRCSDSEDYYMPSSSSKRKKGEFLRSGHTNRSRRGGSQVIHFKSDRDEDYITEKSHKFRQEPKRVEKRSDNKLNQPQHLFSMRDNNNWILDDSSAPSSPQ